MTPPGWPQTQGLYDPQLEKDSCGVGFVVDIKGRASHEILRMALQVLKNLLHRGACGCEANTGDGAGILMQMPHAFLAKECAKSGIALPGPGGYGVGMIQLPTEREQRVACQKIFEAIVQEEGQRLLGWRDVPTDNTPLGATARSCEPVFRQLFIGRGGHAADAAAFERKLFLIRKRVETAVLATDLAQRNYFYIPSLSSRTLIYKGMLSADQIETYFPDLVDPSIVTALALVHQRFSTNTFPSWSLAHPFRYMAHNGEINTLRGNINWMHARERLFASDLFGADVKKLLPVLREGGSDSAIMDNALEMLVMCGRSLPHAVMMLIPEPWQGHESMSPEKKAFYEYHSCLMEPWDGPASIAFTDGSVIGAVLDRNGLRPSRYYVTVDGLVIMASEVGVLEMAPERLLQKGRLQPGRMFLVDTTQGRIIDDAELKLAIATAQPYDEWLERYLLDIRDLPEPRHLPEPDHHTVLQRQIAFGYTHEDLRILMGPMAEAGEEPIGSMGNDAALAVLSNRPRPLYDYFKQLFAQVTNPPLDAIREALVTSVESTVGPERNLLKAEPESCQQIVIHSPILTNEELAKLRGLRHPVFKAVTLPMLFRAAEGGPGLERAMEELWQGASAAIAAGANLLILSDRGVDKFHAPIPALLATAGVHHHLVREGTRTKVGLIVRPVTPARCITTACSSPTAPGSSTPTWPSRPWTT